MMIDGLASVINGGYSLLASAKSDAGICTPLTITAHNRADAVFLCAAQPYPRSMVGRAGQPKGWPVSVVAGSANPVRLTTHEICTSGGELAKLTIEAVIMTTIPALAQPTVTIERGRAVTSSVAVADYFNKRHDDVIRKIRSVMDDCDEEYRLRNFTETSYVRENPNGGAGISTPMFELTRDAFVLIVMGFTGKKALQWKINYINAFNKMEATLSGAVQRVSAVTQEEKDAYNINALVKHFKFMLDAWRHQIEPALRTLESPLPGRLNSRFSDGYVFLRYVEKSLNEKLLPGQSPRIVSK